MTIHLDIDPTLLWWLVGAAYVLCGLANVAIGYRLPKSNYFSHEGNPALLALAFLFWWNLLFTAILMGAFCLLGYLFMPVFWLLEWLFKPRTKPPAPASAYPPTNFNCRCQAVPLRGGPALVYRILGENETPRAGELPVGTTEGGHLVYARRKP